MNANADILASTALKTEHLDGLFSARILDVSRSILHPTTGRSFPVTASH